MQLMGKPKIVEDLSYTTIAAPFKKQILANYFTFVKEISIPAVQDLGLPILDHEEVLSRG